MVLHAVNIGADIYLDIAILLSLLSLVGTLAVAKYVVGAK
jgi:multisubunit Na+/H+ antiporter MnhF subunit